MVIGWYKIKSAKRLLKVVSIKLLHGKLFNVFLLKKYFNEKVKIKYSIGSCCAAVFALSHFKYAS